MNTPIHTMQVKMLPKGFTPTGITPNRSQRRSKDYANYLVKIQQAILSKEELDKEIQEKLYSKLENK